MLIITNGDASVAHLKNAGVQGTWLAWRDVLHDGPVPARYDLEALSTIRAKYLADQGWGSYDMLLEQFRDRDEDLVNFRSYPEVLLWFERDLYDQLQLLQILHWFSLQEWQQTKLSLISSPQFITNLSADRIAIQYLRRKPVTERQLSLAAEVWNAFCAPAPSVLSVYACQDLTELLHLNIALYRLFEEFPDVNTGLSRNEYHVLRLMDSGVCCPRDLFREQQRMEPMRYLGDWSFWAYLSGLMSCRSPLIATSDSKPFLVPPAINLDSLFLERSLRLTNAGRNVLSGVINHVQINGIDKWIGGTHLMSSNVWCWNPVNQRFEKQIDRFR